MRTINDISLKEEFLFMVETLMSERFQKDLAKKIVTPLHFALMQPNSCINFDDEKVNSSRTIYKIYISTDKDYKLENTSSLNDFDGHDVSLRLIVDNDLAKLDYNFFAKIGNTCESRKQHLEYHKDQFKKETVSTDKYYQAIYQKNGNGYDGTVIYRRTLNEFNMDDVIKSSKTMEYSQRHQARNGEVVRKEALINQMPECTNGKYTTITRLATDQAVINTVSDNIKLYSLATINPTIKRTFAFIGGTRQLDEDDARYVLKRYSLK